MPSKAAVPPLFPLLCPMLSLNDVEVSSGCSCDSAQLLLPGQQFLPPKKNLNTTGILFLFIPFHWCFQGHLHKTSKILDGKAGEKASFVDTDINTVCMWKNSPGKKCIKRYQGTIDAFLSSL